MKVVFLPFSNGSHDESAKSGAADRDPGGEGSLLLEVHGHAHDGRQVNQPEAQPWNFILLFGKKKWIFYILLSLRGDS